MKLYCKYTEQEDINKLFRHANDLFTTLTKFNINAIIFLNNINKLTAIPEYKDCLSSSLLVLKL